MVTGPKALVAPETGRNGLAGIQGSTDLPGILRHDEIFEPRFLFQGGIANQMSAFKDVANLEPLVLNGSGNLRCL